MVFLSEKKETLETVEKLAPGARVRMDEMEEVHNYMPGQEHLEHN